MLEPQGGVGISSRGVAVLGGAFISILAYTYWLELSRDKLSFQDSASWHEILNNFVLLARDDRSLSLEF